MSRRTHAQRTTLRNTRGWAIGIAALAAMVRGYVVSQGVWGDVRTSGGWNVHGHRMGAHGGWTGSRWMAQRNAGGMGMMGGTGMMGGMGMIEIYPHGAETRLPLILPDPIHPVRLSPTRDPATPTPAREVDRHSLER